MHQRTASCVFASLFLLSASATAQITPGGFEHVSSIGVEGVAEIVDSYDYGRRLIFTNSAKAEVGIVDISDPSRPRYLGEIAVAGEPTSVSVAGGYALVTVWADKHEIGKPAPKFLPGKLYVLDLAARGKPTIIGTVDIGWHPDSVKAIVHRGQLVAVIAIENEPVVVDSQGIVIDEDRPGSPNDKSPAGLIQVVTVNVTRPAASRVVDVAVPARALTAAGCLYANDPQPEFVAIHGTTAAVSLQENNGIAIVDILDAAKPSLTRVFTLGQVADRKADLTEDDDILFSETYPSDIDGVKHDLEQDAGGNTVTPGLRFPDGISFNPDGTVIYSADEGEFNYSGGRGWSAWSLEGRLLWDDGGASEALAVAVSHYPEGRSENKGVELEGVTSARFGLNEFAFVLSERGSYLNVYDVSTPSSPRFVQTLSTGISPEGIIAIPQRNLVVTADEVSGTLSIFRGKPGAVVPSPRSPLLFSLDGPWAALSGLAAGRYGNYLWAVPDNALPTKLYLIDINAPYARVWPLFDVRKNGVPTRYDGEGIVRDDSILAPKVLDGFWLASEGNASSNPNLLVQTNLVGDVMTEIQLPNAIDPAADATIPGKAQGAIGGQKIRSNGFEGVAMTGDGRYLVAAVQRDFANEFPSGPRYTRIARYDLQQIATASGRSTNCNGLRCGGDWDFFYLELDSNDGDNWAGLSEILAIGDNEFLVVERDKGIGVGSKLKKLYAFTLDGLKPDADGKPDATDTVKKVLASNVLRDFFPYEKVEGLAITKNGHLWVGLDNDGGEVEPRLIDKGRFRNPLRR
ncbi:MAG: esterase-like activity of phytase family protein [Planctomycetes bacterium]|nr:esterase-like activity of phytase family protein [Planctomycetota bacterium]